jgi:4'-phosphopantetheinyl transferase
VALVRVDLNVPDDLVGAYRSRLSAEELERADRFVTGELTRRFVVCRAVLRRVLGLAAEIPAEQVAFQFGPYGKPALALDRAGVEFNVSHTGDVALIALACGRVVGVDVETVCERITRDELASRFFSVQEREAYFSLPMGQRREAFFRIWTCKEAFLKAIGAGLSFPLGRFSVSPFPDAPPGLLEVQGDPEAPRRWSFVIPDVGERFAAALAVEGHGWTLRCGSWDHRAGRGINWDLE